MIENLSPPSKIFPHKQNIAPEHQIRIPIKLYSV